MRVIVVCIPQTNAEGTNPEQTLRSMNPAREGMAHKKPVFLDLFFDGLFDPPPQAPAFGLQVSPACCHVSVRCTFLSTVRV
jgi:hypothetical protein